MLLPIGRGEAPTDRMFSSACAKRSKHALTHSLCQSPYSFSTWDTQVNETWFLPSCNQWERGKYSNNDNPGTPAGEAGVGKYQAERKGQHWEPCFLGEVWSLSSPSIEFIIHPFTLQSSWPTARVLNRSYGLGTMTGTGDTMVNKINKATLSAASILVSMGQGE